VVVITLTLAGTVLDVCVEYVLMKVLLVGGAFALTVLVTGAGICKGTLLFNTETLGWPADLGGV